ncbi:MAG: hypothetical protein ACYCS8_01285 [Acidithiobacillus sp.]|jgi:hypothetical protein|nr:hypothetical protein [Acidithiobacillus ferrooxidans F221]
MNTLKICGLLALVLFMLAATADRVFMARFPVAWQQERRGFWISAMMLIGVLLGYGIS